MLSHFSNPRIENQVGELVNLLLKKKHDIEPSYKQWQEDYKLIYQEIVVDYRLYLNHAVLYYIGLGFFLKFLYNKRDRTNIKERLLWELEKKRNELNYFKPLIKSFTAKEFDSLMLLVFSIIEQVLDIVKDPEYIFDYIVQKIMSPEVRHESGEFYTPPFLVKRMVKETYMFGSKVLDPCCGSGNFLIEIFKTIIYSEKNETDKLDAINNVNGFDINPLSIFLAKINLLYLLRDFPAEFKLKMKRCDYLFPEEDKIGEKFDLIIGNPPWYTLRDVNSIDSQKKIKSLSEELEIKPLPKNILNIEISTLFFYLSRKRYLKNDGRVFFLMTKGVITGSHASRFRNFKGFKNIMIWTFDKMVETIFNIDFICIQAQKASRESENSKKEIPARCFTVEKYNKSLNYFDGIELKEKWIKALIPYFIEKKGNKKYTKKLILKELKKNLLPNDDSYYKELFHKGADLNPRNLIFVECTEVDDSFFIINPDKKVFKRAKEPWTKIEYKDQLVEKRYIFKVIKSTELIKFYVYDSYRVFLPLSQTNLCFEYENLSYNARAFYDKINAIYLKKKKETTQYQALIDNIDRWGK